MGSHLSTSQPPSSPLIFTLPPELLLLIAENLTSLHDVYSLFLTCRRFSHATTPRLHDFAVQQRFLVPPLQWAASLGHIGLAKILLSKGFNVNDSPQSTSPYCPFGPWKPLCHAIQFGSVPMVKLLLEHGATVDDKNRRGDTALHTAIAAWKSAAMKVNCGLLREEEQIVQLTRMERMIEILGLLLARGPDLTVLNDYGQSALHSAALHGTDDTAVLHMLLRAEAPVDLVSEKGSTALHLATISSSEAGVRLLLHYRADVNMRNQEGLTPLLMAVNYGLDGVEKLLIDAGGNVDAKDRNGDGIEEYRARCVERWRAHERQVEEYAAKRKEERKTEKRRQEERRVLLENPELD